MTAAVIGAGAAPAAADCPVNLAGDPDTVGRVEHALTAFGGDDAACVSLRATCTADPDHLGGIVLELQDAFGRSAHRTVASVDGAVALLVSWSRRPVPMVAPPLSQQQLAAAAPPTAEVAAHAAPIAPPPALANPIPDRPPEPLFEHDRQLELRFQAIGAPEPGQLAFDVDGAFVRRRGIFRYGGDVRFLETSGNDYEMFSPSGDESRLTTLLSLDATGVFGVVGGSSRWLAHAEAALGGGAIIGVSSTNSLVHETQGVRGGVRAGVDVRLAGTMWFELGAGWEAIVRIGAAGFNSVFPDTLTSTPHLDAGLLWVL